VRRWNQWETRSVQNPQVWPLDYLHGAVAGRQTCPIINKEVTVSVNKWYGIGNLCRDPETKYTPSGVCVCNFSIACNERFTDKNGDKHENVEFINIVAWRQLAEICGKYLQKGKQVFISGKLQTRSYDDRDGKKRYISEIVADQMQLLGSRAEQGQAADSGSQGESGGQNRVPGINEDEDLIPF
jgi:single-strand DNA-binding protein